MAEAIPDLRKSNLLKPANQELVPSGDVLSRTNMSPVILGGIADLFIVFDAGKKTSDKDEMRKIEICAEVLMGFEVSVAEYVLKRMRRFNPRNPFPPTAQDLYEECVRVLKLWRWRLQRYFIEGAKWGSLNDLEQLDVFRGKGSQIDPLGPPPLATGCWIPPGMITEFLRPQIANAYDEMRNRENRHDHSLTVFEEIGDERFNEIPEAAFDGVREEIATLRCRRRERDAKRQRLLMRFQVGDTVIDSLTIAGRRGVLEQIDQRNERVIVRFNSGREIFHIWNAPFAELKLALPSTQVEPTAEGAA